MNKNLRSNQAINKFQKSSQLWPWERRLPSLPTEPGIYYFLSEKNEVLYVGKSVNIKSRVQSYKSKDQIGKTRILLQNAKKLKVLKLDSQLEANLVEAELIRSHKPKYNLRLKDDKSPIYILVTKENYPRVLLLRKNNISKSKLKGDLFGPFTSSNQTRHILKVSRKIFPFCNSRNLNKQNNKPCFYYHLKLCPGVCVGKISKNNYQKQIKKLKIFLKGSKKKLLSSLKKEMLLASKSKNYELAAQLRDQQQKILLATSKNRKWTGDNTYKNQTQALKKLWSALLPFFSKKNINPSSHPFKRIEAYDVSNIQGKHATASMVVFSNGIPDKNQYRRFKIKLTTGANDTMMLAESIYRRLNHRDWPLPNLILVDGGKGQVKITKKVLASFGLHHKIPIIGLAKPLDHIIAHKHTFHIIELPKDSKALYILQQIRDEAHRFARNYHLTLREVEFLK